MLFLLTTNSVGSNTMWVDSGQTDLIESPDDDDGILVSHFDFWDFNGALTFSTSRGTSKSLPAPAGVEIAVSTAVLSNSNGTLTVTLDEEPSATLAQGAFNLPTGWTVTAFSGSETTYTFTLTASTVSGNGMVSLGSSASVVSTGYVANAAPVLIPPNSVHISPAIMGNELVRGRLYMITFTASDTDGDAIVFSGTARQGTHNLAIVTGNVPAVTSGTSSGDSNRVYFRPFTTANVVISATATDSESSASVTQTLTLTVGSQSDLIDSPVPGVPLPVYPHPIFPDDPDEMIDSGIVGGGSQVDDDNPATDEIRFVCLSFGRECIGQGSSPSNRQVPITWPGTPIPGTPTAPRYRVISPTPGVEITVPDDTIPRAIVTPPIGGGDVKIIITPINPGTDPGTEDDIAGPSTEITWPYEPAPVISGVVIDEEANQITIGGVNIPSVERTPGTAVIEIPEETATASDTITVVVKVDDGTDTTVTITPSVGDTQDEIGTALSEEINDDVSGATSTYDSETKEVTIVSGSVGADSSVEATPGTWTQGGASRSPGVSEEGGKPLDLTVPITSGGTTTNVIVDGNTIRTAGNNIVGDLPSGTTIPAGATIGSISIPEELFPNSIASSRGATLLPSTPATNFDEVSEPFAVSVSVTTVPTAGALQGLPVGDHEVSISGNVFTWVSANSIRGNFTSDNLQRFTFGIPNSGITINNFVRR